MGTRRNNSPPSLGGGLGVVDVGDKQIWSSAAEYSGVSPQEQRRRCGLAPILSGLVIPQSAIASRGEGAPR